MMPARAWGPNSLNTENTAGSESRLCAFLAIKHHRQLDLLPKSRLTFQIECSCDTCMNLILHNKELRTTVPTYCPGGCKYHCREKGSIFLGKHNVKTEPLLSRCP